MPLRTRSFSGKLLKRYRSKTKLNEEKPEEPVPALPSILPGLDVTTSWNIPLSHTDGSTSSLPHPRVHRRSRSFSELLSIASNGTTASDFAPAQPWRDREAWAAIHSPSQGPIKGRNEASVMHRTYGWKERDPENVGTESGRRGVKGRDFKFFHNTQNPSTTSLVERDMPRYATHGRSRLGESTNSSSSNTIIAPIIITTDTDTRPTSANDSSSTISSMELSTNPHTPPTSIDQHFNPHSQLPDSATSTYSDDLPLPPLLPHNVKRADSPTAFTSRFPAQVPWAQRSTMKDIREASNLRWATGMGSGCGPSTPPPGPPTARQHPTATPIRVEPPRTPPPQHRRKRSMTAPSVFDNAQKPLVRPESGTLPLETPSPPRPPRHPKRQTRAPPPIPLEMPVAIPYSYNPSPTPTSKEEEFTTPLSSPMPQSPAIKAPSAFYKPTMPLRSVGSASSLRPGSRRPSTAPTQGSALLKPAQIGVYPSTPPTLANRGFERLSRNTSSSSATRGGWI